jgi:peptidoglycan/LPS O-acetylase OafA/YrhL
VALMRIACLDLLRGIAAFAVATCHYALTRSPDDAVLEAIAVQAVEVFFVLSGFVLGPQIVHCVTSGSLRDLGIFLTRRWMRTVPPYAVALGAVSVLAAPVALSDFLLYLTYAQNLLAQATSIDYYPVAWSLSVEEWFYVLFPASLLAGATVAGTRSTRFMALAAVLFIVLVSALRLTWGDDGNWGEGVRRVVVFRLDSIAYGFLLFLALRSRAPTRPGVGGTVLRLGAAASLMVASAQAAFWVIQGIGRIDAAWLKAVFPFVVAGFALAWVFFFLSLEPITMAMPRFRRLADFLGRISYPVYLFHLPALIIVGTAPGLPSWGAYGVYLGPLVVFTAAFHWLFEVPILALRPAFARHQCAGRLDIAR